MTPPPDPQNRKLLSMRKLKDLALTDIPKDHPLRDVFLAEKEYITVEEFLIKLETWLTLMERKGD